MMRRTLALMLALAVCLSPRLAGVAEADGRLPKLGVCIYKMDDTFMYSMLEVILRMGEGLADIEVYDSQNNQNTQNSQVELMLKQGMNALIVNAVDRTAAIHIVRMGMQYGTPIVFINREPLPEDLALYDKAYYVGIDPKQQGRLEGDMAANYFRQNPGADLNGDGRIQLVIFKGEPGHQDAELRTQYALQALSEAGVQVSLISEEVAMWDRALGQERMAALLNAYGDGIECVISNNDDMALGAIDALKAAGYFSGDKYIPIFGIDATAPAIKAVRQDSLYATVYNNPNTQGAAAFSLAMLLARDEEVNEQSFKYPMKDRVVYLDSICFTREGLMGD